MSPNKHGNIYCNKRFNIKQTLIFCTSKKPRPKFVFKHIYDDFLNISFNFHEKQPTLPIHDDIHGMLVSGMQPSLSDPPSDDMHHPMDHPDGPDGKSQTNFLNIYFLIFSLLLCI